MHGESTEVATLLWEQAQRQLAQQSSDLDTLRTLAIAMLSVASLVAALFGSRIDQGHLGARTLAAVVVALVLFAAGAFLALFVTVPRKRAWLFTFDIGELLTLEEGGSASPSVLIRSLTDRAEQNRRENEAKIEGLYRALTVVCVLVGLQVVAWAVAVL